MSNFLDIVYVVINISTIIAGLYLGFIKTLINFCFFCFSFLCAYYIYLPIYEIVTEYISDGLFANIVTIFSCYIIAAIFCSFIAYWVKKIVDGISGGFLDRAFGALIGFGRGILLSVVVSCLIEIAVAKTYKNSADFSDLFDYINKSDKPKWLVNSNINQLMDSLVGYFVSQDNVIEILKSLPISQKEQNTLVDKKIENIKKALDSSKKK